MSPEKLNQNKSVTRSLLYDFSTNVVSNKYISPGILLLTFKNQLDAPRGCFQFRDVAMIIEGSLIISAGAIKTHSDTLIRKATDSLTKCCSGLNITEYL